MSFHFNRASVILTTVSYNMNVELSGVISVPLDLLSRETLSNMGFRCKMNCIYSIKWTLLVQSVNKIGL